MMQVTKSWDQKTQRVQWAMHRACLLQRGTRWSHPRHLHGFSGAKALPKCVPSCRSRRSGKKYEKTILFSLFHCLSMVLERFLPAQADMTVLDANLVSCPLNQRWILLHQVSAWHAAMRCFKASSIRFRDLGKHKSTTAHFFPFFFFFFFFFLPSSSSASDAAAASFALRQEDNHHTVRQRLAKTPRPKAAGRPAQLPHWCCIGPRYVPLLPVIPAKRSAPQHSGGTQASAQYKSYLNPKPSTPASAQYKPYLISSIISFMMSSSSSEASPAPIAAATSACTSEHARSDKAPIEEYGPVFVRPVHVKAQEFSKAGRGGRMVPELPELRSSRSRPGAPYGSVQHRPASAWLYTTRRQ